MNGKTIMDYGFYKEYFKNMTTDRFADSAEQLFAWRSFVDMVCLLMLVQREAKPLEVSERISLFPDTEEMMQLLEPQQPYVFPQRAQIRAIYDTLRAKCNGSDLSHADLSLWQFSFGDFDDIEFVALLLAYFYASNKKYAAVFSRLQSDEQRECGLTAGLVRDFCSFFLSEEENDLTILLDQTSVFHTVLVNGTDTIAAADHRLVIRPQVFSYIYTGTDTPMGDLTDCAEQLEPMDDLPDTIVREDFLDELVQTYHEMILCNMQGVIYLQGGRGCGISYLVQNIGTIYGMPVLQVDLPRLLLADESRMYELLRQIIWKCLFERNLLLLEHCSGADFFVTESAKILNFLQRFVRCVIIGSEDDLSGRWQVKGIEFSKKMPAFTREEHGLFWQNIAEDLNITYGADFDIGEIVSKYRLQPGKILDVLLKARVASEFDAQTDRFIVDRQAIEAEIRRQGELDFKQIAQQIPAAFTLEDLFVSSETKSLLTQVICRVKNRSRVYQKLWLDRQAVYGNGISVLFYGPPGTGKTMAAQVIASELGLSIFRCDLSQLISKYIGETAKNLNEVFNAAEKANAVLFFDEADSLFTKRMEVSTTNDKHANAETAFLLQRMEAYSGVCILATNVAGNFDNAFIRRITYAIAIHKPTVEERLLLWQKLLAGGRYEIHQISPQKLAENFEFTGSEIKSISINAAFLAEAHGGDAIERSDLIQAILMERRKQGELVSMGDIASNV